jgi:hypothetical protein
VTHAAHIRLVTIAAALACIAAIALGARPATAADGAPEARVAACNTVSYDGRSYVLFRERVRCRFARRWVRRLHNSAGENKPDGWRCTSGSRYRTGGNCTKGERAFGWHPGD